MLTGQHGFAWMVTPGCAELDRLGPFHLFNNPGPMDSWYIRNWHYCGRYYAHRTGRRMALDGWQKLPQAVSFGLRSRYAASTDCVADLACPEDEGRRDQH